jgi:mono/diheme cytochrome c family protein
MRIFPFHCIFRVMKQQNILRRGALAAGVLAACAASAQPADPAAAFPPEQVVAGAKLYAANCAVCHGPNMVEPGGGFFDLRTFPPAQRSRFFNSVSNGKNSMPPWKSVLSQDDIGNLFAYVVAGEKKR